MRRRFGHRVDHAAEARHIITVADNEHDGYGIGEAQVHATLALAGEQHTANLIAYMAAQARLLESHPDLVDIAGLRRVTDAAWEGLGL